MVPSESHRRSTLACCASFKACGALLFAAARCGLRSDPLDLVHCWTGPQGSRKDAWFRTNCRNTSPSWTSPVERRSPGPGAPPRISSRRRPASRGCWPLVFRPSAGCASACPLPSAQPGLPRAEEKRCRAFLDVPSSVFSTPDGVLVLAARGSVATRLRPWGSFRFSWYLNRCPRVSARVGP
jgi:hypothetical protein